MRACRAAAAEFATPLSRITRHSRAPMEEGRPTILASPMVHQSDLAFRLQVRRYDVDIASTPMLHARLLSESRPYRDQELQTHPDDFPLMAQLCGHDPGEFTKAAGVLRDVGVSAVDINFGCPQNVAKRGKYGAYLLEDVPLMQRLVSAVADAMEGTSIPITCKMRCLDTHEATLGVAKSLVDAGASVLTIHGRTLRQNKQRSGSANWGMMRDVCNALRAAYTAGSGRGVSVVANGSVASLCDAEKLAAFTGAEGVMSAEALLENPAAFMRDAVVARHKVECASADDDSQTFARHDTALIRSALYELRQSALAAEYISISRELIDVHGTYLKPVRAHLFKYAHASMQQDPSMHDIRDAFARERSFNGLSRATDMLGARCRDKMLAAVRNTEKSDDPIMRALLEDVVPLLSFCGNHLVVKSVMRVLGRHFPGDTANIEAGWYFRHPRV